jgi:hypothetical protein
MRGATYAQPLAGVKLPNQLQPHWRSEDTGHARDSLVVFELKRLSLPATAAPTSH